MVDLTPMRGTYVDPVRRRAHIEAVRCGTTTTGRLTTWPGNDRRCGLDDRCCRADAWRWGRVVDEPLRHGGGDLASVEPVTANGDAIESAPDRPELFRGLRGGGGNSGWPRRRVRPHPLTRSSAESSPTRCPRRCPCSPRTSSGRRALTSSSASSGSPRTRRFRQQIVAVPVCYSGDIAAVRRSSNRFAPWGHRQSI